MATRARVTIGHATDETNETGCTAVLFSEPVPCVVDVRGGAPGTRETDLLRPGRLVQRIDAIMLSGGSAFGLATADGAMRFLRERGRGFPTAAGPVPIVPAAVIFDLTAGSPSPPDQSMGYVACQQATPIERTKWGSIGAGRGATTGKITGKSVPGGIGYASVPYQCGAVAAIAVVNAYGIVGEQREVRSLQRRLIDINSPAQVGQNTTLVVVLVDANIDHDSLAQVAVSAHDGMARAIVPCHTPFDGDLVFAVGLGAGDVGRVRSTSLCLATELAVESAILAAVATK